MEEYKLPKAWEAFSSNQQLMPIVVKSLEKIHDANWSMNVNKHDHFEMVYIKKGVAVFQIAGVDVNLNPNDIVIIKPYQFHKFIVKSENACEFIVLSFKFQPLQPSLSENPSDVSLNDFINFVNNHQEGAHISIRLGRKNEIITILNKILRERQKGQIWSDFLIYLLFLELFVQLSRALRHEWEQNMKSRSLKLRELLQIAKEYMDENYERDLSLEDVSKYVFLSESYFAHAFKDEFRVSPKSYLLKVRIDASKELLAEGDMKVSDIALSVGFSSQQRFNDIFKKYEGITPLKYRKIEKDKRVNKIL